jgi:peptide deformylase
LKTLDDLLVLGDSRLYEISSEVQPGEWTEVPNWIESLDQVMKAFRKRYPFGRAIAAPQIAIMKRLIYMNMDGPLVFVNPKIIFKSEEMFEVWDDCMCFPNLLVKVRRHKKIKIEYLDEKGLNKEWELENELSELFQHEYDHLEGILCTLLAIDQKSFKWRT